MASSRFLDRSARVLWARVIDKRRAQRPWLTRLIAAVGGLALACTSFFVLKAAALATGAPLPGVEGAALWLAGPDPLTAAFGQILQPVFAGRV
jgi:hypothetical protein